MSDTNEKQEKVAEGGSASATTAETTENAGELTFETWIDGQDEKVRGLLESHTNGLKSALNSERETRKEFEKQVKTLLAQAEKGSAAETQLTALQQQLESSNRRMKFLEDAMPQGVSNLKLAWLAVSTEDLFDKKGNVDFATLKERYPEVYKTSIPAGNAGEGGSATTVFSMNDAIRQMAGRTTTS